MRVSILEFGMFSKFDTMMENGMSLFENNIIEFKKLMGNCKINIDLFVLTQENDKAKFHIFSCLCSKLDVKLKRFTLWDDIKQYHDKDHSMMLKYNQTFSSFVTEDNPRPMGFDLKRPHFNAGNMWYRRYLCFKIYKNYCKENNIVYHDIVVLARMFSSKLVNIRQFEYIDNDILYFSSDSLFFSSFSNMKKLLDFGKHGLFNASMNFNNSDLIMNEDINFKHLCYNYDSFIYNHYFCSEIQIMYYIHKNFKNYSNIRFNFTKYLSSNIVKYVYLTLKYPNEEMRHTLSLISPSYMFITIFR